MSLSDFLRERGKGVADNIIATLLYAGGAVGIGWLTKHLALYLGISSEWAVGLAWAVGLLVAVALSLLLKPKPKSFSAEEAAIPQQQLTQSGITIINNPSFNNNPQFNQSQAAIQSQSQNQSQHQAATETTAKPNLIPLEPRIGFTESVSTYVLKERAHYIKGNTAPTAIAEFSNEIVSILNEVAPLRNVKARIVYYKDDKVFWRSSTGWWIDNEYNTVSFEPHQIRKLVLAIDLEQNLGHAAFANHHESYQDEDDSTEYRILEGDMFRAEVQLISGGTMVGCFNYNLLLRPVFGVRLIQQDTQTSDKAKRLELARELEKLLKEGLEKLRAGNFSGMPFWEVEVKMRIERGMSKWMAEEFCKETDIKTYPYSVQPSILADYLYTLTERLGVIISELKKD